MEVNQSIKRGITDEQAMAFLRKYSRSQSVAEFQSLDEKQKRRAVQLTKEKGVSIRQLSRLTGLSKGVVERWLK